MKRLSTLLIAIPLFLSGCELIGPTAAESLGEIPFETLKASGRFHVSEPGTVVFRNRSEWKAFWDRYGSGYSGDGSRLPAPQIDFSRKVVAGIFWKPQGGCDGRVQVVQSVTGLDREVQIQVGSLPDLGPCRAVVRPQQVIVFARTKRSIVFTGKVP